MKTLLKKKSLNSREIKKIVLGLVLSDASIDKNNRFDFYSKSKEYAQFVCFVLGNITGANPKMYKVKDYRFNTYGYRVYTKKHVYFAKMRDKIYAERKFLSKYTVSRIEEIALSQIWISDGYLERNKNRKKNKIQNIGWICLDAFPEDELKLLQYRLKERFGINSRVVKSTSAGGFGFRIKISGKDLQKFISLVYPYILESYKYKTYLFYKTLNPNYVDLSLPNAKRFIKEYDNIEDIVRYF